MVDQAAGLMYGVWSMVNKVRRGRPLCLYAPACPQQTAGSGSRRAAGPARPAPTPTPTPHTHTHRRAQESLEGYGEVAAFKREHIMHPLPLDRVDGLLLKLGNAVKLPQKVPAATVSCTP